MEKDVDKKILEAALEVVSKEKISGTRMHIIAEKANMSQANLHYHFSTKNDIMLALLDTIQEKFSKDRSNYIDSKNKNIDYNISGFFEQKKDDILKHKNLEYAQMDYWVQGTVNEEIRAKFQKTFNVWRSNIEDVLPKDIDMYKDSKAKDNISYIMVSLMMGASLQYLMDEGGFSLDDYFEVSKEVVENLMKKDVK